MTLNSSSTFYFLIIEYILKQFFSALLFILSLEYNFSILFPHLIICKKYKNYFIEKELLSYIKRDREKNVYTFRRKILYFFINPHVLSMKA